MARIIKIINTDYLHSNVDQILNLSNGKNIIWMIKANAYGNDQDKVCQTLLQKDQNRFGVYTLQEARYIDAHFDNIEMFLLDGLTESEWNELIYDFTFKNKIIIYLNKVSDLDKAVLLNDSKIEFDVFVETGFHWYGVDNLEEFLKIAQIKNIKISGICSHLASADNQDNAYNQTQIEEFNKKVELAKQYFPNIRVHLGNSWALLDPNNEIGDFYRIGRLLYGGVKERPEFVQVVKVEAEVLQVKDIKSGDKIGYNTTFTANRDMTIAVLAMGYNDGLDTRLSNNGFFMIKGKQCRIVGRVAMHITVIDVSDVDVKAGDYATFTENIAGIRMYEIAERIGAIDYEMLVRLGQI